MRKGNVLTLAGIIALLALALWVIVPLGSTRLGREGLSLGLDLKGGTQLIYQADLSQRAPEMTEEQAMKATMKKIERRITSAYGGVTEPIVQKQGADRVLVQIPGIRDTGKAIELIGKTAHLDFRETEYDEKGNPALDENGKRKWVIAKATGSDGEEHGLTGSYFKPNAHVEIVGQANEPVVAFEFNHEGGVLFKQITERNLNKQLAIFLDDEMVSAPVVRGIIEESGIIEGLTIEEARILSIQLNSGALDVPLTIVKQQNVDPTLGKDSIEKSIIAGIIGLIMLLLFIILYYRLPGFVACCSLAIYGSLVLAVFKLYPVTLTLPGIAAFILSLGMAVDANVLIFERMKEELRGGRTLGAATEAGFNRAWTAIRDSNISTLIICVILWWFGNMLTEPRIVGFAQTLIIGVLLSMFSAIVITRTFLRFFPGTWLGRKLALFRV